MRGKLDEIRFVTFKGSNNTESERMVKKEKVAICMSKA